MNYRWSLGTLIGLPAGILGALILAVGVSLCWRWYRREKAKNSDYGDESDALVAGGLLLVGLLAVVIGTALAMWPYDAEYHQWRPTRGTVQAVDSRLVAADHGSTQRFVVTFTDGRQRACDDTRCAQVKVRDFLTLDCKRAWQWAGTPGYDCNFVDDRKP